MWLLYSHSSALPIYQRLMSLLLNTVFWLRYESDSESFFPSLLICINRYIKKFPQNHKNHKKILPKIREHNSYSFMGPDRQCTVGLLMILIFTFSISHRQCTTLKQIENSKNNDPASVNSSQAMYNLLGYKNVKNETCEDLSCQFLIGNV